MTTDKSPRCQAGLTALAVVSALMLNHPVLASAADDSAQLIGRAEGAPFSHVPNPPATLVGMSVTARVIKSKTMLFGLAPIYRAGDQPVEAQQFGTLSAPVRAEARPGYAVGAIVTQTGNFAGMRLIFMREAGDQLDPNDSYESRWLGLRAAGQEIKHGGDGRRIVGLQGFATQYVNGLSLVYAGSGPVKLPTTPGLPPLDPVQALADIKKLGARITPDDAADATRVTEVDLSGLQFSKGQLAPLRAFTELESLDMSDTFSASYDLGLEAVSGLTKLKRINLHEAYPLGREGMAYLRNLTELRVLDLSNCNIMYGADTDLVNFSKLEELYANYDIPLKSVQQIARFRKLKSLVLRETKLDDAAVKLLITLPELTRLEIYGSHISDEGLAAIATCSRLERLVIASGFLTEKGAQHLPKLTQLKHLTLMSQGVGDEAMRHVGAMKQLTSLSLAHAPLTNAGVASLAGLTKLEDLNLYGTQISDDAMKAVAQMPQLKELDLAYTQVSDAGLQHLSVCPQLKYLILTRTPISGNGLAHLGKIRTLEGLVLTETSIEDDSLARLRNLTQLRELHLEKSVISQPDWTALQALSEMQVLRLGDSQIGNAGLAGIAQFGKLQKLTLTRTGVTDAGLAPIGKLSALEELELGGTNLTDAGLSHLAKLDKLRTLNLMGTKVTDAGLPHLEPLAQLKNLNVSQSLASDQCVAALSKLPNLLRLAVTSSHISRGGVKKLQVAMPRLQVFSGHPNPASR